MRSGLSTQGFKRRYGRTGEYGTQWSRVAGAIVCTGIFEWTIGCSRWWGPSDGECGNIPAACIHVKTYEISSQEKVEMEQGFLRSNRLDSPWDSGSRYDQNRQDTTFQARTRCGTSNATTTPIPLHTLNLCSAHCVNATRKHSNTW